MRPDDRPPPRHPDDPPPRRRGDGPPRRGDGPPRRGDDGPPRGRAPEPPPASAAEVSGWLAGRLPADWFEGAPEVTVDRDEITVVGRLSLADVPADVDRGQAEDGRIRRFREDTRDTRITIAREAQDRFGREVAWGARAGESAQLFTHLAVPAMTRLRQPERLVLDTLVDAGVARSRADALAWCVRLVGQHQADWIASLRAALGEVERVRGAGPA